MNQNQDKNEQEKNKGERIEANVGVDRESGYETGFIMNLFDFSFENFITKKLIKILYILAMIGSVLFGLSILASGLASGQAGAIIFSLIFAPFVAVVTLVYSRVLLELMIVLFSIAEDVSVLRRKKEENN